MCHCVDIGMGTYANTVILGYYPIMHQYRDNRIAKCLPANGILVDRCIADEMIELWEADIRTYGSCCGHNLVEGMINVDSEDFEKAIALGWEKYEFIDDSERCDTIKVRSTGNTFKPQQLNLTSRSLAFMPPRHS